MEKQTRLNQSVEKTLQIIEAMANAREPVRLGDLAREVDMPASTTLLVVGDKPGMDKLNKADRWIAQVRKITPAQFDFMLKMPLSLTPDEFAALVTK